MCPSGLHSALNRFDISMANRWGYLKAALETKGRPMPVIDSLIAATALERGLTLVARKAQDFADTGVKIFNPWVRNARSHAPPCSDLRGFFISSKGAKDNREHQYSLSYIG